MKIFCLKTLKNILLWFVIILIHVSFNYNVYSIESIIILLIAGFLTTIYHNIKTGA